MRPVVQPFGLMPFLVLLLLGAMAPSAPANAFEAETYPVALKGERSGEEGHVITTDGLQTICGAVALNGELTEPVGTVDLTATYSECSYAGGGSPAVNMNGCKYRVHVGEELESQAFKGTVDVVCEGSESIVITSHSFLFGSCQVKIGAQSGIGEIELANDLESLPRIKGSLNLKSLKYTKTVDTGFCALNGTGEKSDGTYVGEEILKGEAESQAKGVAVARNTRLCAEDPVKTCEEVYKEKISILAEEATLVYLDQETVGVKCTKSKLSLVNAKKEEAPLYLEQLNWSLTNCETDEAKPTSCTAPKLDIGFKKFLAASFYGGSEGSIHISPMSVVIECGNVLKCKYGATTMKLLWKNEGGKPKITPKSALNGQDLAGEVGCKKTLSIQVTYTLEYPLPIWVTNR